MITLDGSFGEGGGQILRTSLGLSMLTGTPFRIEKIRAKRKKPGLGRQHLLAVKAATRIANAETVGAALGSQELSFRPAVVLPGRYEFKVNTAGSMTLVAQTVLPALMMAEGPSELTLEGGTHNPYAPPFDFLEKSFFALLRRMGVGIEASLIRPGFYPNGGGRIELTINPAERLKKLELLERGPIKSRRGRAIVSALPRDIAEREAAVLGRKLGLKDKELSIEEVEQPRGPGNVVLVELTSEALTEVIVAFGERGLRAEKVASRAAKEAKAYLDGRAPVGEHLADQLLIPMALAGGGAYRTGPLSDHTRTNIEVVKRFLDVAITTEADEGSVVVRLAKS